MSTPYEEARERIEAYLNALDEHDAKAKGRGWIYGDTLVGLDDLELTRTDLRAVLGGELPRCEWCVQGYQHGIHEEGSLEEYEQNIEKGASA